MEKKGVDGFLDSKEAKVTTLLLFSILIVFVLTLSMSSVFVSALNISIYSPRNYSINANVSRNINITFNSTWQLGGAPADESPTNENVSNCTLYINSTDLKIAWDSVLNISGDSNATGGSNLTGYSGIHSNISNSSISYMNFTFPEDGNYTIGVACLNATNSTAVAGYTFSGNFSFFLDVSAPTFNFTYPLNTSFNTSSSTITSGINFTVNDTGIGLNWTNSTSMNITIHLGGSKIKNFVYNGSDGQSNLTCSPNSGVTRATSTCNATYAFNSNGTYTINATATDALGTFGFSLITFTVDQIPPRLRNFTITNGSTGAAIEFNMSDLQLGNRSGNASLNGVGTATQGRNITAFGNFSDNLTRPLMAILQFLNESKSSDNWQTLNTTNTNGVLSNSSDLIMSDRTVSPTTNFGIVNLTFLIPVGRNEFEGKNVTFRMLANDTFGNINNSGTASSVNLTILINDTFGPTIGINGGTAEANGTNTTDTTPTIVWNISESNRMTSINISVDFATGTGGIGVDSVCNKFAFYDKSSLSASANAERNRNGTFTITDDPACTLGNGTHNISIVAIDSWGNREVFHHVFSLQSGGTPGLNFNLTNEQGVGGWNKSATNNSNITSKVGISLFGVSSVGSSIDKISYFSSCDSTVRVENNGTIVYPFNASSCSSLSANRTLRVTINDTAGNSNTTVLGFLVDNVAPSLTVNHPTNGETFTNIEAIFNLTALDNDQAIGGLGYYLDGSNVRVTINITTNQSSAGTQLNQTNATNLTGTHTIKFTVNDTLGNTVNGSVITFRQIGSVNLGQVARTINLTLGGINVTNISIFNSTGGLPSNNSFDTNQTLELYLALNQSASGERAGVNITINFNGTAANWNKTDEIFFQLNESVTAGYLRTNYTTKVLDMVYSNNFTQFLANDSYFAKIRIALNATDLGVNGTQLLYFPDESNLKISPSASNITQCAFDFSPIHSAFTACWNTTNNLSVDIFIPHFSAVVLVDDTDNATINVTAPLSNHTSSMFTLNITVSADTVSCSYSINTTSGNANETMTLSGTTCFGSTERFKNLEAVRPSAYNITFYARDAAGNVNTYLWDFNISDTTPPNTPNSSRISTSVTSTTATITIGDADTSDGVVGINETVNATVLIANGSSVTPGTQTDFNTTQVVSLTGLSASTTYHFNVSVCDYAGNCAVNATGLRFTTSAASSTSSSSTSSDSGGGGGGGAATVSSVTDSKAQVWQSVPSGSSVTLEVDKSTIAVTSVVVNDVKSELKGVELEVAALSENPVTTEAAPKVYQYFRITKKNIADADAGSFKVEFRVTKLWLSENGLASADVALYRFAGNEWNELATKVKSTDGTYVNYEADTPGFSSFAIGTKSGVKVEEEAPEEEKVSEGEKEAPPEAVGKPKPVEVPSKAPVAWIIAAVVVILGIVLIVAYQKQKKKA